MKALIVAGLATVAGIAGVVGLADATDDQSGSPPAAQVAGAGDGATVARRLSRLREAERAADAALRRADEATVRLAAPAAPRVPVTVPATTSAPGPVLGDRDDDGEHHETEDDRGRDHEEDD